MRIHKEGRKMLLIIGVILLIINVSFYFLAPNYLMLSSLISLIVFGLILQFFRNPIREIAKLDNQLVYAPADGKVVVIEEVFEEEYFKDKRIQVSIFMNPFNVHVNRNPIGGTVNYYKYHPGKYLVAWHPKSSTENERTTVVIGNNDHEILLRQIAGAMAKRIINYLKIGEQVEQGTDMGFIKFGSRVDLFFPLDAKIEVSLDQKVKGNKTVIAKI